MSQHQQAVPQPKIVLPYPGVYSGIILFSIRNYLMYNACIEMSLLISSLSYKHCIYEDTKRKNISILRNP